MPLPKIAPDDGGGEDIVSRRETDAPLVYASTETIEDGDEVSAVPPAGKKADTLDVSSEIVTDAAQVPGPESPETGSDSHQSTPQKEQKEKPRPPLRPRLTLDRDVLARSSARQNMPLVKREPIGASRRFNVPVTPQQMREHLMAQGWRFKTKPGSEPDSAPGNMIQAATSLDQSSGSGKPLAAEPRETMEGMIGRDFSAVRVHRTDLSPLNIQAATKGRDVVFDESQDDDFQKPKSMALLGHELTHVAQSRQVQTKPMIQPALMPVARVPTQVGAQEAEADSTERSILSVARSAQSPFFSSGPDMPLHATVQRATAPSDTAEQGISQEPRDEDVDEQVEQSREMWAEHNESELALETERLEVQELENEALFEDMQEVVEDMLDEKLGEMLEALGIEADEESAEIATKETNQTDLDSLARQVLPFVRRLIAVERERRA